MTRFENDRSHAVFGSPGDPFDNGKYSGEKHHVPESTNTQDHQRQNIRHPA